MLTAVVYSAPVATYICSNPHTHQLLVVVNMEQASTPTTKYSLNPHLRITIHGITISRRVILSTASQTDSGQLETFTSYSFKC